MRKALAESKKVNITISGLDALLASNLEGPVVNVVLVALNLATGMNGFALSNICILVHDGNNRTTLGLNNTTNSHNWEVGELMIINPTHINSTGTG